MCNRCSAAGFARATIVRARTRSSCWDTTCGAIASARARLVGQSIRANGTYRTIIGVMPPNFMFPIRESLWVPLSIDPLATPRGQGPSYQVIARLAPGVGIQEAKAQIATIASQIERDFEAPKGMSGDVMPYAMFVFGPEIYGLLYTMLGAGIGVLLIACVNVSNLLAARASHGSAKWRSHGARRHPPARRATAPH